MRDTMMKRLELIKNEEFVGFLKEFYPIYSNRMLCKLIENKFNIKLKVKDIEKIVYELKRADPNAIKQKYPILLRRKIIEKHGLPEDTARTPNMFVMRISKQLVLEKCMNIVNSIKNRKNVKNIKDIEIEYITYRDMGGFQPSVLKYLSNVGVIEEWGAKTYICYVKKLLKLIEFLKNMKENFVEVINGDGNGRDKRNRKITREN